MNQKASLRARAKANASLPNPKNPESSNTEDTIFEELIVRYRGLASRAEDIIVQQVCGEVEGGLKAHFSSSMSFVDSSLL